MNKNLLLICFFCSLSFHLLAQNNFDDSSNSISDVSAIDKNTDAKKAAIKLYPNPSFGKISVSAITASPLHFYIFDLDGTMVYQAVLNNKEKKVIDKLKKGTYLYDVFENDESIEEGKITVK